jgi:antitoxin component YwqK of YwqJK toxin-antitoxin module
VEQRYAGGKKHGLNTIFYENGLIEYKARYENGKLKSLQKYDLQGELVFAQ